MTRNSRKTAILLLTLLTVTASAQTNGSNSSYSRFGLGTLADQSQGFNRGMGGVGVALHQGNRVNMQNPASYASIDSLSLILDVGMSLSAGHIKNGGTSVNVKNCSLDFVNAGLRLRRGLGLSFGFVPYSTIGYSFYNEKLITNDQTTTLPIKTTSSYSGDGGLHQAYIGLGWRPVGALSIGANVSFMWGTYSHTMSQTFAEGDSYSSAYSGLNSVHHANLKTYKLDFGAQYPIRITPSDWITIGVTAGLGHKIKSDATLTRYTSVGDSTKVTAHSPFDLPYTYGGGLAWQHKNKLLVAADYHFENWSDCRTPHSDTSEGELTYTGKKGDYKNRSRIAVGAQYTPDPADRHYLKRMQYRLGANYSTPYLRVNGTDGPSEMTLSAGLGLPITNQINNRSMVNVNLQWLRRKPSSASLITENYFMVNVGLTFNENWFMKFKIQ